MGMFVQMIVPMQMIFNVRMRMRMCRTVRVSVLVRMLAGVFARLVLHPADDHVHLRCGDSVAVHARSRYLGPHVQGSNGCLQQAQRHAGIDECAEQHVPTDSAKAIEISDLHKQPCSTPGMRWRSESFILGCDVAWVKPFDDPCLL